ncbi:MAG TPA: alpha/beta fold hydrolase [Gemmatimonadaceae bacterium]|jgi:dipeptidyl aminopeptidase/acylaminoacyl peptidase
MSRVVLGLVAVLALLVAWELRRAVRAYRIERTTLYPPRGPVPAPKDSAALGIADVSFPSRNGTTLRGWYIPSRDGAAVVLVHGSGSDRSSLLPEIRSFAGAGFGILAFDLPGHGESDGEVTFGLAPVEALQGAIDFLLQHPDVHDGRVGATGFSYGGMVVSRTAATDCRVRAVALVGTPADAITQTKAEYASYGRAAQIGAFAVYSLRGIDLTHERPLDYVGKIAPRPVLIVGGAEDTTVPLSETQGLFAAAREPKRFLLIPHGAHGRFTEADSSYSTNLKEFFESALVTAAPSSVSDCPK